MKCVKSYHQSLLNFKNGLLVCLCVCLAYVCDCFWFLFFFGGGGGGDRQSGRSSDNDNDCWLVRWEHFWTGCSKTQSGRSHQFCYCMVHLRLWDWNALGTGMAHGGVGCQSSPLLIHFILASDTGIYLTAALNRAQLGGVSSGVARASLSKRTG